MDLGLKDKVAAVAASSSGLGKAVALGLAREGGPEAVLLAGSREEVLEGVRRVAEAALDAGARAVEVRIEAEPDAPRFGGEQRGREERDG